MDSEARWQWEAPGCGEAEPATRGIHDAASAMLLTLGQRQSSLEPVARALSMPSACTAASRHQGAIHGADAPGLDSGAFLQHNAPRSALWLQDMSVQETGSGYHFARVKSSRVQRKCIQG